MLKKTKPITYNLSDRGRSKGLGVDRSGMDIQSMIELINSELTQEMIEHGDMQGYYGHELRARFGLNPPDVWVNPETGESVRIEPAIRTIKLFADNDGNVTHQEEFLGTDAGKYAQTLYESKVGGFSSAITTSRTKNAAGKHPITGFFGFDYVRQANYVTNKGDGLFDALFMQVDDEATFDSLQNTSPERVSIMKALETAIIHQFDSINSAIHSNVLVDHYQQQAVSAQNELVAYQLRQAAIQNKRQARSDEIYDSLICPSVSFDTVVDQWGSFSDKGTGDSHLVTAKQAAEQAQQAQADAARARPKFFRR